VLVTDANFTDSIWPRVVSVRVPIS